MFIAGSKSENIAIINRLLKYKQLLRNLLSENLNIFLLSANICNELRKSIHQNHSKGEGRVTSAVYTYSGGLSVLVSIEGGDI